MEHVDSRLGTVREVVKLLILFENVQNSDHEFLTEDEITELKDFRRLVLPVFRHELRFAEKLDASAAEILRYLDADDRRAVASSKTYRDMWLMVNRIDSQGYFETVHNSAPPLNTSEAEMTTQCKSDSLQHVDATGLTCICAVCQNKIQTAECPLPCKRHHLPAQTNTSAHASIARKPVRCARCSKSFFTGLALARHLRKLHVRSRYVTCIKSQSAWVCRNLVYTACRRTGSRPQRSCAVCRKVFHYDRIFDAHVNSHVVTPDHKEKPTDSDLHENPTCSVGSSTYNLRRKSTKISKSKSVSGFKKDSKFPSSNDPGYRSAEGAFKCKICHKRFATRANVARHMCRHTGQRPFACRKCPKSFWDSSNRMKHEQWHVPKAERPSCTDCGLAFMSKTCHLRHLNGGFENRRCSVCGGRHSRCAATINVTSERSKSVTDNATSCDQIRLENATLEQFTCTEQSDPVLTSFSTADVIGKNLRATGVVCEKLCRARRQRTIRNVDQSMPAIIIEPDKSVDEEILSNGELGRYKCPDCSKVLATRNNLERHYRLHTGHRPFECGICGAKFSDISNFKKHMQLHTMRMEKTQTVAGRGAADSASLEYGTAVEAIQIAPEFDDPLDADTMLENFGLKIETVTESLRPGIDGQSRVFRKTGLGAPRFECPVCSKGFMFKSHMEDHARRHDDVRPYQCETCGKLFKRSGDLLIHSRFHDDEKQFACPECEHRFRWKSALQRHLRVHSGERPFLCTECGRAFADYSSYKHHVRVHDTGPDVPPPERFPCPTCGKSFAYKRGLARHVRTHSTSAKVSSAVTTS